MTTLSLRLREAVEEAYRVFGARDELRAPLQVCHCPSCMSEATAEGILTTPLRQLSKEQLTEYTNSAHGWSEQFLVLLPRYMELISEGEWPTYLGPESVLSRFADLPGDPLTADEHAAFATWLRILFEEALLRAIAPEELSDAENDHFGLAIAGIRYDICDIIDLALPTPFDTLRFQQIWESCDAREAALRLAATISFGISDARFRAARYRPESAQAEAARWYAWFTKTDRSKLLGRAFERETDPRAQEFLLAAM